MCVKCSISCCSERFLWSHSQGSSCDENTKHEVASLPFGQRHLLTLHRINAVSVLFPSLYPSFWPRTSRSTRAEPNLTSWKQLLLFFSVAEAVFLQVPAEFQDLWQFTKPEWLMDATTGNSSPFQSTSSCFFSSVLTVCDRCHTEVVNKSTMT